MKFSCPREPFLDALQTAASVAAARSPKPILQKVKLEVGPDQAFLLATDLELAVRVRLDQVDVNTPGEAMLPPAQLGQILREARDEQFVLESTEQGTVLRLTNAEFQLLGEDPEEFPPVPDFQGQSCYVIEAEAYREMVRRTVFAADTENVRQALSGVLWELEQGERLVAVATDGRRLATKTAPVHSRLAVASGGPEVTAPESGTGPSIAWPADVIVPSGFLQRTERIVGGQGEVEFYVEDNHVRLRYGSVSIHARLLEGRFPKWREVVPNPSQPELRKTELVAGPLLSAMRQASALLGPDDRGVLWQFDQGELIISGQGTELGQGQVRLPVAWEGEKLVVRLNPKYVQDFLRVLSPEASFTACLQSSEAPVLFVTEDGSNYVVMPMAL